MEVKCLADIDISNTAFFTLTNPHYKDSGIMEVCYQYPEEQIHIIEMFKIANRLGIKISYSCRKPDAMRFMDERYREYIL